MLRKICDNENLFELWKFNHDELEIVEKTVTLWNWEDPIINDESGEREKNKQKWNVLWE